MRYHLLLFVLSTFSMQAAEQKKQVTNAKKETFITKEIREELANCVDEWCINSASEQKAKLFLEIGANGYPGGGYRCLWFWSCIGDNNILKDLINAYKEDPWGKPNRAPVGKYASSCSGLWVYREQAVGNVASPCLPFSNSNGFYLCNGGRYLYHFTSEAGRKAYEAVNKDPSKKNMSLKGHIYCAMESLRKSKQHDAGSVFLIDLERLARFNGNSAIEKIEKYFDAEKSKHEASKVLLGFFTSKSVTIPIDPKVKSE